MYIVNFTKITLIFKLTWIIEEEILDLDRKKIILEEEAPPWILLMWAILIMETEVSAEMAQWPTHVMLRRLFKSFKS